MFIEVLFQIFKTVLYQDYDILVFKPAVTIRHSGPPVQPSVHRCSLIEITLTYTTFTKTLSESGISGWGMDNRTAKERDRLGDKQGKKLG